MALGDVASVRTGATFRDAAPKEAPSGNVHALAIRDLLGAWPIEVSKLPKIIVPEDMLRHCLSYGEVLIPSRGNSYHARFFNDILRDVFPIGQINVISPHATVNGAYLAWYLNQEETQRLINSNLTGTNIKALNKRDLLELPIHVPPPEIQDQIANIQTQWAQIRGARERLTSLEDQRVSEICTTLYRKSTESI